MSRKKTTDPKLAALRRDRALNPSPEEVHDTLFLENPFFDARDLLQVKYEMLRRVQAEHQNVSQTAADFGLSRPAFYQAARTFDREGLPGLLPKKRGPHGPHKLTPEILAFLQDELRRDEPPDPPTLAQRVRERFAVSLHPRTVGRTLVRMKKKRI